jgi:hypothetical protein
LASSDARPYIRGFDPAKEGYLAVTGPYGNQFRLAPPFIG